MKLVSKSKRICAGMAYAVLLMVLVPASLRANGHEQPGQVAKATSQDFTKTIKKEFPMNATGTVNIVNKYGKVDMKTWEHNRVNIEITIVVNARSESAAQEVFDRIDIDFSNNDSFVKAETGIESKNSFWSWGNDNTEFQVNYEVFMPSGVSIELNNKYGDANVMPIAGKADVQISYGNFRLEGVGGALAVGLDYGNGTVVKAGNANADISYSKMNFTDVQDVNFTSKYSKIAVDKCADLKADSRYDHFNVTKANRFNCQSSYGDVEIGSAESVIVIARYTDYKIERLGDNADFDMQYGGVTINQLARGFSNVNLLGKYADFKIIVETGSNYLLDANANYAGVAYPENLQVSYEKEKGTSHEVKGHSGVEGARSVIKAQLSYGGLKVRQQ